MINSAELKHLAYVHVGLPIGLVSEQSNRKDVFPQSSKPISGIAVGSNV